MFKTYSYALLMPADQFGVVLNYESVVVSQNEKMIVGGGDGGMEES